MGFPLLIALLLHCRWRRAITVLPLASRGLMASVVMGHMNLRKHLEPPWPKSPRALWEKMVVKAACCALIEVREGVLC